MYNCSSYYYHRPDTDSVSADSIMNSISEEIITLAPTDEAASLDAGNEEKDNGHNERANGNKSKQNKEATDKKHSKARQPQFEDVFY